MGGVFFVAAGGDGGAWWQVFDDGAADQQRQGRHHTIHRRGVRHQVNNSHREGGEKGGRTDAVALRVGG